MPQDLQGILLVCDSPPTAARASDTFILLFPFVASQLLDCCVDFSKFCQEFAHFFGRPGIDQASSKSSPRTRLAARQACGLVRFIYVCSQCLRPRRLAAFGHLYIFACGLGCLRPGVPGASSCSRPGTGRLVLIQKKRGLVAPDTCYPADARAPAKRR